MAWTLRDEGFKNVKALLGGFDAWMKAKYPVEPKEEKPEGRRRDGNERR